MVYSFNPQPRCILFVDEDREIRSFVKSTLEKEGYQVLTARNSVEALVLAADFPGGIDVLLTEAGTRVYQNGLELGYCFNIIRPETQVVLTSTMFGEGYEDQVAADQGWELLPKPFSKRALLSALETTCAN